MKTIGMIQYQNFGQGTWTLVTESETFELKDAPSGLCKSGQRVEVEGVIRDDVMSLAMVGPILEVQNFKLL